MSERVRPALFPLEPETGPAQSSWLRPVVDDARPVLFRGQKRPSVRAPTMQPPKPATVVPPKPGSMMPPRPASVLPPPGSLAAPRLPSFAPAEIGMSDEDRQTFSDAVMSMATARHAALRDAEDDLLRLSVEIASAILEEAIEVDPTLHRALVRAALTEIDPHHRVRLHVSPSAHEALRASHGDGDLVRFDDIQVELVLDESIEGLGCILETSESSIDARLGARLAAVRAALRSAHEGMR